MVALAGGVGAARLLRGLVRAVDPERLSIVVNTGDDREFYGALVCPDLDIVTYTLGGAVDFAKGFGLAGDRFDLMDRLGALGHETWFRLGDRDFAQCLHRTLRMREGMSLAALTDQLRRALDLACSILPMSEDPAPTRVELEDGRNLHFEEYLVRERSPANVRSVDLSAARRAAPGPGVIEAIGQAEVVILCPSNPVVSIGPILAVPGIRDAIIERAAPVVAVSPIIGGAPVKGPADHLLRATDCEVSALGVANLYSDLATGYVFDEVDRDQLGAIQALGLRAIATQTLMKDIEISTALAASAVRLALELR
ncbi:MAG: 2-phospho-L-lactate transferase [bacterium]|nr:2-phospho-L-lactate transferase [bacterium]